MELVKDGAQGHQAQPRTAVVRMGPDAGRLEVPRPHEGEPEMGRKQAGAVHQPAPPEDQHDPVVPGREDPEGMAGKPSGRIRKRPGRQNDKV
jgi:hypothetical protein